MLLPNNKAWDNIQPGTELLVQTYDHSLPMMAPKKKRRAKVLHVPEHRLFVVCEISNYREAIHFGDILQILPNKSKDVV